MRLLSFEPCCSGKAYRRIGIGCCPGMCASEEGTDKRALKCLVHFLFVWGFSWCQHVLLGCSSDLLPVGFVESLLKGLSMAFGLLNCYCFISLKIYPSFKSKQGEFMLGTAEASFTGPDLGCSDFPLLLIAPNESRAVEHFAAALPGDTASYILRGGSFWLTKAGWDPYGAVSIIFKSCYSKEFVLSLSECTALSFLPIVCVQTPDSVRHPCSP